MAQALELDYAPTVFVHLRDVILGDENARKRGEEALRNLETTPGYISILLHISSKGDASQQSERLMAAILARNTINRHWRKRTPPPPHPGAQGQLPGAGPIKRDKVSAISDAEKAYVRALLLSSDCLGEHDQQLALQYSLCAAKIGRFDFPSEWSDLFSSMLASIQTPRDPTHKHNALLFMHCIVKELASKCLAGDRVIFRDLAKDVFSPLLMLWNEDQDKLLGAIQTVVNSPAATPSVNGGANANVNIEASGVFAQLNECARVTTLVTKVLRRITVFGVKSMYNAPHIAQFLDHLLDRVSSLMTIRVSLTESHTSALLVPAIDRYLKAVVKIPLDIQYYQPLGFAQFLSKFIGFFDNVILARKSPGGVSDRVLILSMTFLSHIIGCRQYNMRRPPSKPDEAAAYETARHARDEFLSANNRLTDLVNMLVSEYMMLNNQDLVDWEDDPESFWQEAEAEAWNERPRDCAEMLYKLLVEYRSAEIGPMITRLLYMATSATIDGIPAILMKDAVYRAVGLQPFELEPVINFGEWLRNDIWKELSSTDSAKRILRRRAAWAVGRWVGAMPDEMRTPTYKLLINLMRDKDHNDLVVRVAAVEGLRSLIDDMKFDPKGFIVDGMLETSINTVVEILSAATTVETKLLMVHTIMIILEQCREYVVSFAPLIANLLPSLWDEENMMKIAVLGLTRLIVELLGTNSPSVHSFALPIIQMSIDTQRPESIYLMEEGLRLWSSIIRHTPVFSEALSHLFTGMVNVMTRDFEFLRLSLSIIEGYLLLDPSFLAHHSGSLLHILNTIIGNVRDNGMSETVRMIDTLLQVHPAHSPGMFEPVFGKIMSLALNGNESETFIADCMHVFGRLVLVNPNAFHSLISHWAQSVGMSSSDLMAKLIDVWVDRVDNLFYVARRKLATLALVSLLRTSDQLILMRCTSIVNVAVQLAAELTAEPDSVKATFEYFILRGEPDEDGKHPDVEPESERKRNLYENDAVFKTDIALYASECLKACVEANGQPAIQLLNGQLPPELKKEALEYHIGEGIIHMSQSQSQS